MSMVLIVLPPRGAGADLLPSYCTTDAPIDATTLPAEVPLTLCDLTGKVVSYEGLNIYVPPSGTGQAAYGEATNGSATLDILNDELGTVYTTYGMETEIPDTVNVPDEEFIVNVIETDTGAVLASGASSECEDRTRSDRDRKESQVHHWMYLQRSTPDNLTVSSVELQLKQGVAHITDATNNCGVADAVSAAEAFDGASNGRTAEVDGSGCDASWTTDGYNVVDFGDLPDSPRNYIALNCQTYVPKIGPDEITHVDVRFAHEEKWTDYSSGCNSAFDIEAIFTHESGHTFGLKDLFDSSHASLTMYHSNGKCSLKSRTLGIGDLLSLKALY